MMADAREDTQRARSLLDAAMLEAAADGAVQQAIFATLDTSGQHWAPDGVVHMIRSARALISVRIESETDKINPNTASPELLVALLRAVGAPPETAAVVADSIVEWRQAIGVPGRPNATVIRYVAAGREYGPSGAPFTSLDQLGAVLDMTPDLLVRLRPHMTVFTDADPDASTHDPVVAQALATVGETDTESSEDRLGDVVSIIADARGPEGARFDVHVIARTNAEAGGRRYSILSYERNWAGP